MAFDRASFRTALQEELTGVEDDNDLVAAHEVLERELLEFQTAGAPVSCVRDAIDNLIRLRVALLIGCVGNALETLERQKY